MEKKNRSLQEFVDTAHQLYLSQLSIDCVIAGFHDGQLKVLLLKMKHLDEWALPGGFIQKEEPIDDSATRILQERTGLRDIFLHQFHVFGDPARSNPGNAAKMLKKEGVKLARNNWFTQRFITIGYYALVDFSKVHPAPDELSDDCRWWDIHDLPPLILDHRLIIEKALHTLQLQLRHQPIGYELLPAKFTMPELQKLYETILDKKLDRRNFQRKMLAYGILRRLKERKQGVAHKAPFLYSFDLKKYHKALKDGLGS